MSEPMRLLYSATNNVAVPLFTPSDEFMTLVGFDPQNRMNIQSFDDSVEPAQSGPLEAYYRWFVCETIVGYVSVDASCFRSVGM